MADRSGKKNPKSQIPNPKAAPLGDARDRQIPNPKVMSLAGGQGTIEMRERGGDLLIRVRVQPKASADAIVGAHAGAVKIKVAAAPEDGKANRAAIEFLAESLGLKKSDVTIVSGAHSKDKLFSMRGVKRDELLRRLESLLRRS